MGDEDNLGDREDGKAAEGDDNPLGGLSLGFDPLSHLEEKLSD
jgi:hypothetical protein